MYMLSFYVDSMAQSTHQVLVMSTDIRSASEIALDYDGDKGESSSSTYGSFCMVDCILHTHIRLR